MMNPLLNPVRTPAAPDELPRLDLASPHLHAERDLTDVFRHLRDEDPVYWHPERDDRPGFWVVSRYQDVARIFRDNKRFTSERGNVLETLLGGGDSAGGKMLAVTDGDRHKALRNIMLKAFSPKALSVIVDSVRRAADRLVSAAVESGECDFAGDVAARIPLGAVCDLLGVPESDRADVLSLTSAALSSDHEDGTPADAFEAKNEILLYFAGLAAERRDTPHNDVVSLLAASEIDGEHLDDVEVMLNCYSLILGGDETSRLSMIGGARALMEQPEQWKALKSGDVTVESAVEEVLRWTTPALHAGRTAEEDVEVEGRTIRRGDIVTIWNSSANFDERVFTEPGVFDLARKPNKHLTFAYGPHFCLGAYLARMEIGAVLDGCRRMAARMEPAGPAKAIYSNFLSGLSTQPVRFEPEPDFVPAGS